MAGARDLITAANRELINERKPDLAADYFQPKYAVHVGVDDTRTASPEFVRDFLGKLLKAFPDLDVEVEVLADAGDRIAWMRTCTGTHEANFMGLAPSGKSFTWREMLVSRIEDGKIAEEWHVSDMVERFVKSRKSGGA